MLKMMSIAARSRLALPSRCRAPGVTDDTRAQRLHHAQLVCCSSHHSQPPTGREGHHDASSTADAVIKCMQALSTSTGRTSDSTHLVLGSNASEESQRALDQKVNKYPLRRYFKAIYTVEGDQGFRETMLPEVEKVLGTVHKECVSERLSGQGKYCSVTIGPVWVQSVDQVAAVYSCMQQYSNWKRSL